MHNIIVNNNTTDADVETESECKCLTCNQKPTVEESMSDGDSKFQ